MASEWRLRRMAAAQQQARSNGMPRRSSSMRRAYNYVTGRKSIDQAHRQPSEMQPEITLEAQIQGLRNDLAACQEQLKEANELTSNQDRSLAAFERKTAQFEQDYRAKEAALLQSKAIIENELAEELAERIKDARKHEREVVERDLLASMETERRKFKVRIATMAEELHASKSTAEQLKISYDDHVDSLESQLDARTSECQQAKATLTECSTTLKQLTTTHQEVLQELEAVRQSRTKLQSVSDLRLANLEGSLQTAMSDLEATKSSHDSLKQTHDELQTKHKGIVGERDDTTAIKLALEKDLEASHGEIASLRANLNDQGAQSAALDAAKAKVEELSSEIKARESENQVLQQTASTNTAHIAELEAQIVSLESLTTTLKSNMSDIEESQKQLKEVTEQHAKSQSEMEEHVSARDILEGRMDDLKQQHTTLSTDLAAAQTSNESLRSQIAMLEGEKTDLTARLDATVTKVQSLENEKADLQTLHDTSQAANTSAEKETEVAKRSLLEANAKHEMLQNEATALREQISSFDIIKTELQTKLDEALPVKLAAEEKTKTLQADLNATKAELTEKDTALASAHASATEDFAKIKAELEQKLAGAESEKTAMTSELEEIKQQLIEIKKSSEEKVESLTKEHSTIADKLVAAENKYSVLEAGHMSHADRVKDLESQVETANARSTTLEAEKSTHSHRIQDLEMQLAAAQTKHTALEAAQATHADHVKDLETQIKTSHVGHADELEKLHQAHTTSEQKLQKAITEHETIVAELKANIETEQQKMKLLSDENEKLEARLSSSSAAATAAALAASTAVVESSSIKKETEPTLSGSEGKTTMTIVNGHTEAEAKASTDSDSNGGLVPTTETTITTDEIEVEPSKAIESKTDEQTPPSLSHVETSTTGKHSESNNAPEAAPEIAVEG